MSSGVESGSDPGSQDPYARLGITAESGFEAVQQAKASALEAAGDDPQARAKVEAAYDAVLMARLRERQTGKISMAAVSASEREQQLANQSGVASNVASGVLTRLRQFSVPIPAGSVGSWVPSLDLVEGQGLAVRAIVGGLGVVVLLAAAGSADLVLSLATIGLFLSQIRRGRRALASVGWSLLLLALGLGVGVLLSATLGGALPPVITVDQIQALPALLLMLAGALLLS